MKSLEEIAGARWLCRNLAEHILDELPLDDSRIDTLAAKIQEAVEDFMTKLAEQDGPEPAGTMRDGIRRTLRERRP
jgi:hypothetical protein